MNNSDMEKLAKLAAKEAVSETFLTLGMDISNPISVQTNSPSCEISTTPPGTFATSSLPGCLAHLLAGASTCLGWLQSERGCSACFGSSLRVR